MDFQCSDLDTRVSTIKEIKHGSVQDLVHAIFIKHLSLLSAVIMAVKLFLTLPVTVTSSERSDIFYLKSLTHHSRESPQHRRGTIILSIFTVQVCNRVEWAGELFTLTLIMKSCPLRQ